MGFFDVFGREQKSKTDRFTTDFDKSVLTGEKPTNNPVSVFKPSSFEDVESIIVALKSGKTAIVHLTDVKHDTQIRVLDMLSGAIFALNGGVYEMDKNVFMFSPNGLEIY